MKDEDKSKAELIAELQSLRQHLDELNNVQSATANNQFIFLDNDLYSFIDSIPGIVCFKDGEGRWLEANIFCRQLLGLDEGIYKGKTDIELAEYCPQYKDALIECAKTDTRAWSIGQAVSYEEIFPQANGCYLIFDVIKTPVYMPDGSRKGLLIIGRDITARKQAELQLAESEKTLRLVMQNIPDIICRYNKHLQHIFINSAIESYTNLTPADIIGKSTAQLFANPEHALFWTNCLTDVFSTGQRNALEWVYTNPKGDNFKFHITLVPEFNPHGSIESVLCVARDITATNRIENQMARLDRLNLVGEMAAGIGHEVRNPMTTVRGFLQLLSTKADCTHYKEYFDLMISELDRANSIISEFLALAKDKTVTRTLCNLNTIIQMLLPLVQAEATVVDKHVLMYLSPIPDLMLDEKEIRQLILNLVFNALEAVQKGERISIKTFLHDDEVVLAVQDEGSGIKSDIMDKIGTPFVTTKEKGTGLGLAVCYSIANRHNAAIFFDTCPQGTTVYVHFKCDQ